MRSTGLESGYICWTCQTWYSQSDLLPCKSAVVPYLHTHSWIKAMDTNLVSWQTSGIGYIHLMNWSQHLLIAGLFVTSCRILKWSSGWVPSYVCLHFDCTPYTACTRVLYCLCSLASRHWPSHSLESWLSQNVQSTDLPSHTTCQYWSECPSGYQRQYRIESCNL